MLYVVNGLFYSDSKYLLSGSHDGTVLIWDTTNAPVQLNVHSDPVIQPVMTFEGHSDTVNGIRYVE
jgi:WD40 repeat protein